MSVSALMVSPLSKHLVHKGIGQSGAFFQSPDNSLVADPLDKKEQDGETFAKSVGASSIDELREMLDPVHTLVDLTGEDPVVTITHRSTAKVTTGMEEAAPPTS